MLTYAIKRIGLAVLILVVVMLAMYAMVFLVPGDPASVALGPRATPALKRLLTERMGLDQPILPQVCNFFRNALTGDLGYDVWSNRPVLDDDPRGLPQDAPPRRRGDGLGADPGHGPRLHRRGLARHDRWTACWASCRSASSRSRPSSSRSILC